MNRACEKSGDSPMPISFIRLPLTREWSVSLATPKPDSSDSLGGKKTVCGFCGTVYGTFYDRKLRLVRDLPCGDTRIYLEREIRRVLYRRCGKVKQEKFPFLANNPFYTKRFAFYVGKRCSTSTVKDVARELHLDILIASTLRPESKGFEHMTFLEKK